MSKIKSIVVLCITVILMGILSVACFANFAIPGSIKDYNSIMSLIGRGIDLSGGYYVVLTPELGSDQADADATIDSAMEVLRSRLDDKGFTEATISRQDGNRIRVEVPEVDNADEILSIIGSTGTLSFQDSTKHEWLSGDDIKSAYVGQDNQNGGYVCVLNFTNEGISKFSEATKAIKDMSDTKMYIYLGDTVVSQPTVNSQITDDSAQITGFATYDEAEAVASVIESGRLPIEYTVSEARSISARLGEKAISTSLLAAGIGLALVFVLMIIMYRGLGAASCLSLITYVLMYIVLLAIVPNIQLTLPGIAGILLSIGMAVDANVIIFERIKHEYASGKMVNSAIDSGFKRALVTIVDGNVTTILSAIVLWILCPGTIKGFAITLLIGIVLSLIASLLFTRWFVKLLLPLSEKKEAFCNLKANAEQTAEVA